MTWSSYCWVCSSSDTTYSGKHLAWYQENSPNEVTVQPPSRNLTAALLSLRLPKPSLPQLSTHGREWLKLRDELHSQVMAVYERVRYCIYCKLILDEPHLGIPIEDFQEYLYITAMGMPWEGRIVQNYEQRQLFRKGVYTYNTAKASAVSSSDQLSLLQLAEVARSEGSDTSRLFAISQLGKMAGPEASPELIDNILDVLSEVLNDPSAAVRRVACGSIGWCGLAISALDGTSEVGELRTKAVRMLANLRRSDIDPRVREIAGDEMARLNR